MTRNQKIINGPVLAAVVLGGGFLARKGIAKAWTEITQEPAPPDQDNQDVDVSEALTWAVLSGVSIGLIKFALRRVNYKGKPTD